MIAFIDKHKMRWGVEPICRVLPIAPSTYYMFKKRSPSQRALRDEYLKVQIERVWKDNFKVYGADKIWVHLNREGIKVARCTVERLMRELGIQGATRGRKPFTTTPADDGTERPVDLVQRDFSAVAPNRLWLCDIIYVRTWSGYVYVSFIIDCFARMIVGWQASRSPRTDLTLDALEQAIWARKNEGLGELVHHSDRGSQYLSIRYTERLAEAGGVQRRQPRRQLRQRARGVGHRPLQDRADQKQGTVARARRRRVRNAGVGRVVEQPASVGDDRNDPSGRSRGRVLQSRSSGRRGRDSRNRVSMKPGAVQDAWVEALCPMVGSSPPQWEGIRCSLLR
jgi:putative transposase